MAEYYLMAQLPSLDAVGENAPLPITEERFLELSRRFLPKKAKAELEKLTLAPARNPEKHSSALVKAWSEGERQLRLALMQVRAVALNKKLENGEGKADENLLGVANEAVKFSNPLEAEKFLNGYRLEFLETLRPMDIFALDSVFYYGLKLKLLSRMRQFDAEKGQTAYKNIYTSVIGGEDLEVAQ